MKNLETIFEDETFDGKETVWVVAYWLDDLKRIEIIGIFNKKEEAMTLVENDDRSAYEGGWTKKNEHMWTNGPDVTYLEEWPLGVARYGSLLEFMRMCPARQFDEIMSSVKGGSYKDNSQFDMRCKIFESVLNDLYENDSDISEEIED